MSTTAEYEAARISRADRWVPACGGLETPFRTRSGARLLYVYNFARGRHAFLDCNTDMILEDSEVKKIMA